MLRCSWLAKKSFGEGFEDFRNISYIKDELSMKV